MFEIGEWGKILDGEYAGWYLMIDDDTDGSTGGFYIYLVKDPNDKNSEGYDDWVENAEQLEKYMNNLKCEKKNSEIICRVSDATEFSRVF